MRFLNRDRNEASFLALFDIEATSVGVSIAHFSKGSTTLLWSNRLDYSFKQEADYEHYERSMYATLLEVGMTLTSTGMRAVRDSVPTFNLAHMNVACVLAPPWFFGTVVSVTKEWEHTTSVTRRILDTLHIEAVEKASQVPEAESWKTVVGEAELLEHKHQLTKLNGYPIDTVNGQEAVQASITDYVAFIGNDVRAHVQEILERVLPNHEVHLVSSTSVLSDMYTSIMGRGVSHQGYLVEVGGRVTSIATIRKNTLSAVSTIPLGTHDLLSTIIPDAANAEEARSSLRMLMKQTSKTPEKGAIIPDELQESLSEWHTAVCNTFRVQGKGAVPFELIYLVSPDHWTQVFSSVLQRSWNMPCIRQDRSQRVTPISVMVESLNPAGQKDKGSTTRDSGDSRLKVFSHAVLYSMSA